MMRERVVLNSMRNAILMGLFNIPRLDFSVNHMCLEKLGESVMQSEECHGNTTEIS
jgi:hypothetical protein